MRSGTTRSPSDMNDSGGLSRRRRFWIMGFIAALVVAAAGWAAADAVRRPAPGPHPPERARVFNLPDGKAQIAVIASYGDSIKVQWRDPGGTTWTKPDTVVRDADMVITDLRIRVGGPTLALRARMTPVDTYYDDEVPPEQLSEDDVTVFVVCRDGSCTASQPYDGLIDEVPQVAPDGEHAFLGALDGTFVSWSDDGLAEQRPTGLPSGGDGQTQPLMAPDGSLRVVRGTADPRGCDYTLFTSGAGDAEFTEAARYQDPGDHRRRCVTTLQSFSSDYVVVTRSKYDVWFLARDDDTWSRVTEDPSGQVRYPRTGTSRLAGAYEISGYWHWRQVVATSPDGRRLVVQVHFPGAETWTEPQEVLAAPPGAECISIAPKPTYTWGEEDPFYLHLTCRSRPSPGAAWAYSYPTTVSEDGKTWHSFLATAGGIRVGRDMFFQGDPSYRWTPDSGLREVPLEIPAGDAVTALEGGSFALGHLEPDGESCRLVVRLAAAGDTTWGNPVQSTADPIPSSQCSFGSVSGEKRNVYYHVGGRDPRSYRMLRLVWRDGDPRVEDGPSD